MTQSPAVSVVVATRNRAASLERLLAALAAQRDAPVFEVVVADNGSSDSTPDVIAQASGDVIAVRVGPPGKGRALNIALGRARGDLVVFTDDDVVPHPDWLANLKAAADEFPECNIFGGRIDVNNEDVPGWVRRSYNLMGLLTSAHDKGSGYARYGYGDYPFGPNMAVRRDALAGLEAPYPEYLGPGTELPVGDERSFFLQVSAPESQDRLFVGAAVVWHEVEAENVTFPTALRRCFQAGLGHGRIGLSALTGQGGENSSAMALIGKRLWSCRSLRELGCIAVRHLGYLRGRRDYRAGYTADKAFRR